MSADRGRYLPARCSCCASRLATRAGRQWCPACTAVAEAAYRTENTK